MVVTELSTSAGKIHRSHHFFKLKSIRINIPSRDVQAESFETKEVNEQMFLENRCVESDEEAQSRK